MNAGAAYVIGGARLAGAKAAEALREEGFGGPIVVAAAPPGTGGPDTPATDVRIGYSCAG
jgi:hypothetical protein